VAHSAHNGARPRSRNTVLLISDRTLYPPLQGTRARIIELIRSLRMLGFRVVLVGPPPVSWRSRLRTRLLADHVRFVNAPQFGKGSPLEYDTSPFWDPLDAALRDFRPGIVFAEYIWMAPCLDRVPSGVLKVVDTHDLMHVRRELYAPEGTGSWVDCSADEEADLLRKADVVIAIQQHEKAAFEKLVPDRRVICVPHAVRVRPGWWSGEPAKHSVMFVGSLNTGNVTGILGFLRQGWPLVRAALPEAELRVYGDIGRKIPEDTPGLRRFGYVRSLGSQYRDSAVVINPVTLGTGLKIKSVEALAYGKALVTTPCGAEGLENGAGSAFLVADAMPQLAGEVIRLLTDSDLRKKLERSAAGFARAQFGPKTVFREFLDLARAKTS
jgi:glycosyltransferase involved in cell wall biosynthesis